LEKPRESWFFFSAITWTIPIQNNFGIITYLSINYSILYYHATPFNVVLGNIQLLSDLFNGILLGSFCGNSYLIFFCKVGKWGKFFGTNRKLLKKAPIEKIPTEKLSFV
jgi:hypothetical protein